MAPCVRPQREPPGVSRRFRSEASCLLGRPGVLLGNPWGLALTPSSLPCKRDRVHFKPTQPEGVLHRRRANQQRLVPASTLDRRSAIVALCSAAGNAAVARLLDPIPVQRQDQPPATGATTPPVPVPNTVPPRVDYVFLMNVKKDNFYRNAAGFFRATFPSAIVPPKIKTLDEVLTTVNNGGKVVRNLFIVSHANSEGDLGFSLNAADLKKDRARGDRRSRTEFRELKEANATAGALPAADQSLIDSFTKVEIKGCNIGRSQRMLDALGRAFGGQAEVVAPTHRQAYRSHRENGRTVFTEEFHTFFLEERGFVPNKSRPELVAGFSAKYPAVPIDRWPHLIKQVEYNPSKRRLFEKPRKDLNPPADSGAEAKAFFGIDRLFPKQAHWTTTYQGREADSSKFTYTFHAEKPTKDGTRFEDLTRTVPKPPSDADLIAKEQANSGRPDSIFEISREVEGKFLLRNVLEERTTWSIDSTIVDSSGPAHPPETSRTFYGHSVHAPPPPAAKP